MKDIDTYQMIGLAWGFCLGALLGFFTILYAIQLPVGQ